MSQVPNDLESATQAIEQRRGLWSREEHEQFLCALELYPNGPWNAIAHHVGTRSVRQTITHAQKYWMKIDRHRRGLQRSQIQVDEAPMVGDDAALDLNTDEIVALMRELLGEQE